MDSHKLLVIIFGWPASGQEAIPYANTEVSTYSSVNNYIFINLTDDEIFNLWDTSNLILVTFTEQQQLADYIGLVVFYWYIY